MLKEFYICEPEEVNCYSEESYENILVWNDTHHGESVFGDQLEVKQKNELMRNYRNVFNNKNHKTRDRA